MEKLSPNPSDPGTIHSFLSSARKIFNNFSFFFINFHHPRKNREISFHNLWGSFPEDREKFLKHLMKESQLLPEEKDYLSATELCRSNYL